MQKISETVEQRKHSPLTLAALAFAQRGWAVLPLHDPTPHGCSCGQPACDSPGKHPRIGGGFHAASTDPEQIAAWWDQWVNANIGIAPGRSGLVVADIDSPEAEAVAASLGLLAEPTHSVRTGRRDFAGRHLYFLHPGGVIPNLRLAHDADGQVVRVSGERPGLELKADGGYVVAPPSRHASGRRYQVIDATEPQPLPTGCRSLLNRLAAPATRAPTATVAASNGRIPEGGRNAALTSLAGAMRRQGASVEAIRAALTVENAARCDQPLPVAEVDAITKSVARYAPVAGADSIAADSPVVLPVPTRLGDVTAEPLTYLVDGLVLRHDLTAFVGEGGAGKSTLLLALAGAIACGALALGDKVVVPGPVLIVSGEDAESVVRNRLDALAAGHRWDLARLHQQVHIFDDRAGVDLDDPRWIAHLIEIGRDLGTVFATFDPLVDLCGDGVDENSNTDAKRVTRALRHFMRATGTTPALAMHVSKPGEGRTERQHRIRGASALKNACRKCWWVEGQEGGLEVEDVKRNRSPRTALLRLALTVSTMDGPGGDLNWKAAHLGLDTSGDVVGRDALTLLRWLAACPEPLSGRDVDAGDHGLSRDRATAARSTLKGRGWIVFAAGPHKAKLWSVTDHGKARLLLESGVSGSVR
jgi:putative DNA primase/helicase